MAYGYGQVHVCEQGACLLLLVGGTCVPPSPCMYDIWFQNITVSWQAPLHAV